MPNWVSNLVSIILVLVVVILLCMAFSNVIGEKVLADEKITIAPGAVKTYNVPPGMVTLKYTSDVPVDVKFDGFAASGESHGVTTGTADLGTLGVKYTITNNNSREAVINMRMATGMFNPFGYI
jgi:hypothetical protein